MTNSKPHQDTAFVAEQFASAYPDGIQHHYWTIARSRIVLRKLRQLVRSSDRILDVGCGRGITVNEFRRQGWNVYGCDLGTPQPITPEMNEYLFMGRDAFELEESFRRQAKLLLFLDVLEHIEAPREFLENCREQFVACEYIVVTVPARQEIWSNYDEYSDHFLRYDLQSIRQFIPHDRFELIRAGYFCRALYLPALFLAKFGMNRNTSIRAPKGPEIALHHMLGCCFNWEERLLPRGIPGTSLCCILKKR